MGAGDTCNSSISPPVQILAAGNIYLHITKSAIRPTRSKQCQFWPKGQIHVSGRGRNTREIREMPLILSKGSMNVSIISHPDELLMHFSWRMLVMYRPCSTHCCYLLSILAGGNPTAFFHAASQILADAQNPGNSNPQFARKEKAC